MFASWYQAMIEKNLEQVHAERQACWTESLAVGSEDFIRK